MNSRRQSRSYRGARCILEALENRQLLTADLASSFTGKIPGQIWPTGTTPFSVQIANRGDTTARGSATIELYASTDRTLDAGDFLLGSKTQSVSLSAGKTGKSSIAITHPAGLVDGTYYVLAKVQGDAAIGDANGANDVSTSPAAVVIRDAYVDVSPVVSKIPAKAVVIKSGKTTTLSISFKVQNTGNTTAKGVITGTVYLSADPFGADSGDTLLGTVASRKVSIAPGKTTTFTVSRKLTDAAASGIFRVVPQIVFAGAMADDSSANNATASTGTVVITNAKVAALPQLIGDLYSDAKIAVVGDPELIHFRLGTVGATSSSTVEVDEITADGTLIGKLTTLFDDGSAANGDAAAGDGIYSGVNTVSFESPGTRYFMATFSDWSLSASQRTTSLSIHGVNPATEAQLGLSTDANARFSDIAMNILSHGGSAATALKSVQIALSTDASVVPGSVQIANGVIQWEDINGILQGFDSNLAIGGDRLGAPVPGAFAADAVFTPMAAPALSADEDILGDVLVLSPFASSLSANDPSAEIVTMFQTAHYSVTYHGDAGVTLADFANLSDYAAIELYGHGALLPDNTGEGFYLSTTPTAVSMADNQGDLRNHRLRIINGYYVVTPSYITAYGGSLDGTIVLANACDSANDGKMANAFIGLGAAAYIGYTHPVRATFAANKAKETWRTLLKAEDNTVGDIPGLDTAHDDNTPPAVFFHYGDENATLPQQGLLSNTEFYVRYSWPMTVRDLDTNTTFLGQSAGWHLDNSSEYLTWSGDDTSAGGAETTRADLYSAWVDGEWTSTTTITVGTDWYTPAEGEGPAIVTVGLENKVTHKLSQVEMEVVSPGQESSGTHTVVGTVTITLIGDPLDPRVKLSVEWA